MMILLSTCMLLLILSAFFLLYSWSHTPYGKLDIRLAVPFRILGLLEKLETKSAEEIQNDFNNPARMKKMRRQVAQGAAAASKYIHFAGCITERKIDNNIPVRIYSPEGEGPFPLLIYYHGAGFTFGDLEFSDSLCRSVSQKGKVVVMSVDYRLAPEHPFPSGLTDAYHALLWAHENAGELNAVADRIAVGGDSSGGNFAAAVSLMCRDAAPDLIGLQILIYPILDLANLETGSYHTFATGYGLTKEQMAHVIKAYVGEDADLTNPLASPIYAEDLKKLPPTMIVSARFDVLRDEGEIYAKRLRQAGVPVNYIRYDTMAHGFITANRLVKTSETAINDIAAEIRNRL